MIFYCNTHGRAESVPSAVPFGAILEDVILIVPHTCTTVVMRLKPPNQNLIPDIVCKPVIMDADDIKKDENNPLLDDHKLVVFRATLPKSITKMAGRVEYQIFQFDGNGKQIASTYLGTFNVNRGVESDMPEDPEDEETIDFSGKTLADIYAALATASEVNQDLINMWKVVGEGEVIKPKEMAEGQSGLVGLANLVYNMVLEHFSQTADSIDGEDPHNTRKAIEDNIGLHNTSNTSHPSILSAVAENASDIAENKADIAENARGIEKNADDIAIDQYNIANLQAAVGKTDKLDTSAKNLAGAIIEVNDIAKKARDRANNNETRLISINAQLQGVGRSYAIEDFNDFVKFANGTYSVAVREDRNGDGYDETYYITASDLKTGDNVLLAELDVPDFWFEKTDKPSDKTYTYEGTEFSLNAYNGSDLVGVFHILETDYQVIQAAAMSASKSAEDAAESAKDAKGYRDDTQAIAESIYLKQVAPPLERLQTAIVLPSATLAQIGG